MIGLKPLTPVERNKRFRLAHPLWAKENLIKNNKLNYVYNTDFNG